MENLMTAPEIRKFLSVSRSTLIRLLNAGLPSVGSGRLKRFSKQAVLAWYGENA